MSVLDLFDGFSTGLDKKSADFLHSFFFDRGTGKEEQNRNNELEVGNEEQKRETGKPGNY